MQPEAPSVGLEDDSHFAPAIARPHLERVFETANLLDHNPARFRLRADQMNVRCAARKDVVDWRAVDQMSKLRGEGAFAAAGPASD